MRGTRATFRAALALAARDVLDDCGVMWKVTEGARHFGLERWFAWKFPPSICYAFIFDGNPGPSRRLHNYRVTRAGLELLQNHWLAEDQHRVLQLYCASRALAGQSLAGWEWLR
jgi:hypothetical protein